jgi:hypothetical protein
MAKSKYYYLVVDKENGEIADKYDDIVLYLEKGAAKHYKDNYVKSQTDRKHVVVGILRSDIEKLILKSKPFTT